MRTNFYQPLDCALYQKNMRRILSLFPLTGRLTKSVMCLVNQPRDYSAEIQTGAAPFGFLLIFSWSKPYKNSIVITEIRLASNIPLVQQRNSIYNPSLIRSPITLLRSFNWIPMEGDLSGRMTIFSISIWNVATISFSMNIFTEILGKGWGQVIKPVGQH